MSTYDLFIRRWYLRDMTVKVKSWDSTYIPYVSEGVWKGCVYPLHMARGTQEGRDAGICNLSKPLLREKV